MRGASEFEVGANRTCPQGTPITLLDGNEAHNNGKYGLRIFTGTNHNGEGLPGFYPRKVDSCAPVSPSNPFEPAVFSNFFSWRNGHNGITFGSVAALRIVDAVVADNVMRGIESVGADSISGGIASMGQMRGPWGANLLVRPVIIGHAQDGCPACNTSKKPHFESGPVGWGSVNNGLVRLGMTQPASWGLTVINATFINYDRLGMVAVGGFSKPDGPGYSFQGNYGGETRFSGTRWITSSHRMRWRWNDVHLVTDVDGTFADEPFCAGCHVVRSGLMASTSAFPDCFHDARYDASVCKPNYHFVTLGFLTQPPCGPCSNTPARLSYRGEEGMFVAASDATFLKHKWRPEGRFSLVSLDVSTDVVVAALSAPPLPTSPPTKRSLSPSYSTPTSRPPSPPSGCSTLPPHSSLLSFRSSIHPLYRPFSLSFCFPVSFDCVTPLSWFPLFVLSLLHSPGCFPTLNLTCVFVLFMLHCRP